jgi:hypothetical protein
MSVQTGRTYDKILSHSVAVEEVHELLILPYTAKLVQSEIARD